jgi:hypothetical protein
MNPDSLIQIKTKSDRTWSYRKEKSEWSQTASTGIVRPCSGDQLLSHLLPLAGDQLDLSVTVERKKQKQLSADFADSRRLQKRSRKKICVNLRNLRTTNQKGSCRNLGWQFTTRAKFARRGYRDRRGAAPKHCDVSG